jgi:DNA-binding transcriptional regulator YiaG
MTKDKIKNLRSCLGLTQVKFAAITGFSVNCIKRWEGGSRNILSRNWETVQEKINKWEKKNK